MLFFFVAARWRKHRRQYLSKMLRPFSSIGAINPTTTQTNGSATNSVSHRRLEYHPNRDDTETDFNGSSFLEESSSLGGAGDTSDSKDSQHIKDDIGEYATHTNQMRTQLYLTLLHHFTNL